MNYKKIKNLSLQSLGGISMLILSVIFTLNFIAGRSLLPPKDIFGLKDFQKLEKTQQKIVENILRNRISDKQIKSSMTNLNNARNSLDVATRLMKKGAIGYVNDEEFNLANNELINTKGFLIKVDSNIFDTGPMRNEIENLRKNHEKDFFERKIKTK